MSETSSSPDISFGNKLSLIDDNVLFALTFLIISKNSSVTNALNALISSALGMHIGIFLSSVKQ